MLAVILFIIYDGYSFVQLDGYIDRESIYSVLCSYHIPCCYALCPIERVTRDK
jgi:hypothetical protein